MSTPDLRRRGYDSHRDRALANLRRELDNARRALEAAQQAAAEGRVDTFALRSLDVAAGEARVYGGALAELTEVDFLLSEPT